MSTDAIGDADRGGQGRRHPPRWSAVPAVAVAALLATLGLGLTGRAMADSGTPPTVTVTAGDPPTIGTSFSAAPSSPLDSIDWETCDSDGDQVGTDYLATGSPGQSVSYTLALSDAGTDVCAVEVSALTPGVSGPIGPVGGLPAGSGPTINAGSQPVTQGQLLTVTQGNWGAGASIADTWEDCPPSGGACTPVATGTTYTVARSDAGSTIEVSETATAANGSSSSAPTAPTGVATADAPTDTSPPVITGTAQVGDTLTAAPGVWSNDPTAYGYQWVRCTAGLCTSIPGATGATYVPVAADVGDALEVMVTGAVYGSVGAAYPSAPTSEVVGALGSTPVTAPKPLGRLTATMRWTFHYTPTYTQIVALGVEDATIGSTVTTGCTGRGCPFSTRHLRVRKLERCSGKTTRACLAPHAVDLESEFHGHDLRVGAQVTVMISRDRYVGKYYRFVVRGRKQPAVQIRCLAPGSSRPGRACTGV